MKKILLILAFAFAFFGCQKETQSFPFVGEWHYTGEEHGVAEDVWVSFSQNGTFQMYQKIGEGPHWFSEGEFVYENNTLSGVYSDRYRWKYSYKVSVSDNTLVLTAVELKGYSVTYTKEAIPAQVREKSLPLTKSESVERHL